MSSYVIGTMHTRLDGKTIPYYPETLGEAVTLPKPNGLEGERATLQELVEDGSLGGGVSLRHKDGYTKATTDKQKVFKIQIDDDMPPLEKMGLDIHVNSVWYSPTRYTISGDNVILNESEAGLSIGQKLEYTLRYGTVAASSVSMDRQVIEVKSTDTNVFTINKANFNPARYSLLAIIGGTVIVPERYTIALDSTGKYTIKFNDYTKFETGKIITLLFFYDTPANGGINGSTLTQIPVSAVMGTTGRTIPIPLADYSFKKYTLLLFINSTFIAPRRYTIDETKKTIELKATEETIAQGKTIDFIFTSIHKDVEKENILQTQTRSNLTKYKSAELVTTEWVEDSKYTEFPYSYTVTDCDVLPDYEIYASFSMEDALKYSGSICTTCEAIENGFKVYAYEIPKENVNIKYLIGRS